MFKLQTTHAFLLLLEVEEKWRQRNFDQNCQCGPDLAFIFYSCAEVQSLTICCKTAPLLFSKSGKFKNIGIEANPI